ncbi:MAG TPA: LOG family protein [Candidatus Polarisedimenticolaceae bacterium]|nr:LOG family protein [Candidatus Polarisedimenticolaceae bacterium]
MGRSIAVFGSSEPAPGAADYELARRLGAALARAGHPVVNGGYGGVMEAASRGAREAGGEVIGVTCRAFAQRRPNAYLTTEVATTDLLARTAELIARAAGFVVLPGKAGTLAELAQLWALDRAGCLGGRPVVLLGARWQGLLDYLAAAQLLDEDQVNHTRVVRTVEHAIEALGVRA